MLSEETMSWVLLALRVLLPVFIFFITFGPKLDQWLSSLGPKHSRDVMLRHGWASRNNPKPECLRTLGTATAETAPSLFEKPEPPPERKSKSAKDQARKDGRKTAASRAAVEEPDVLEEPVGPRRSKGREEERPASPQVLPAQDPAQLRQMHFESLVNFVAFNRRRPQRFFLPRDDEAPPPPPKLSQSSLGPRVTGEEAKQANKEAQMVIRGAMDCCDASNKRVPDGIVGMPKLMCQQLENASVDIHRETYSLMIEACIQAADLETASDLLVKLEDAGFSLDSKLLDQVMEIYWAKQKGREEQPGGDSKPSSIMSEQLGLPLSSQLRQHAMHAPFQEQARQDEFMPTEPQMYHHSRQQFDNAMPSQMHPQMHERMQQQLHPQQFQQQQPHQHPPFHSAGAGAYGASEVSSNMMQPTQMSGPYGSVPDSHMVGGWHSASAGGMPPSAAEPSRPWRKKRPDPDLPAFSVPEEFANKSSTVSSGSGGGGGQGEEDVSKGGDTK